MNYKDNMFTIIGSKGREGEYYDNDDLKITVININLSKCCHM